MHVLSQFDASSHASTSERQPTSALKGGPLRLKPERTKAKLMVSMLAASGYATAQTPGDERKNDTLAKIIVPAGSATASDVALVATHLGRLPLPLLEAMTLTEPSYKAVVCKNNVTDAVPSLIERLSVNATEFPESGILTAYNVTSLYPFQPGTAIIASTADNGTELISLDSPGDPSSALWISGLHIDRVFGPRSRFGSVQSLSNSTAFVAAHSRDWDNLPPPYQGNSTLILRRTFAAYFAQTFNAPASRDVAPNLFAYFADFLCDYGYVVEQEANAAPARRTCSATTTRGRATPTACGPLTYTTASNGSFVFATATSACATDSQTRRSPDTTTTPRTGPTTAVTSITTTAASPSAAITNQAVSAGRRTVTPARAWSLFSTLYRYAQQMSSRIAS